MGYATVPVIRLLYASSKITLPESVMLELISALPTGFLKVLPVGYVRGTLQSRRPEEGLVPACSLFLFGAPVTSI